MTSDFSTSEPEQVDDVEVLERLHAAHLLGRCQVEAADEDRQAAQDALLVLVQQLVGPVHQRAQRLLPLLQHAAAAGEQLVAILQPGVDVGHASASARAQRRARAPAECPPAAPRVRPRPAPRVRSGSKAGLCCCARSTNRRTAVERSSASSAGAALGHRQRQDRIGLSRRARAAARGSRPGCARAARPAGWRSPGRRAGLIRCSQLSRIRKRASRLQVRRTASGCSGRPGSSVTSSVRAASPTTSPASRIGARSRNQTPSGYW